MLFSGLTRRNSRNGLAAFIFLFLALTFIAPQSVMAQGTLKVAACGSANTIYSDGGEDHLEPGAIPYDCRD